ncbi:1547_t:CDS:2 [Paraglomus brasilianum]|uniref:1547_t:CDS:1 n=1 Tax=Paraglomus brasilianum TaxID=144538 RepID=A0A9N8ZQW8_9GLOM|nr:1547_t:CDS:2 [Paraglomus brasilianum]
MDRIRTNRPASLKMFDFSDTESGISYGSTENEIEVNTPTYSVSLMDPIEAVMKPENVLEKFVEVGGRRYLNDDTLKSLKYYLPSDQKEVERTYDRHFIDKTMWGGNYSAPVSDNLSLGASVLDIGCGAGAWIMNMALDYPVSIFVGIDIAPLFPESHPANVAFLKCNIMDGLPFPDNTFDFVRQAFVIICINWRSWKEKVVKELIRVTKPGGYIEIMDIQREIVNPGTINEKINAYLEEHFYKAGINRSSCAGVIDTFNEFKDKVIVAPIEERTYYFGKKAGRIGEATLKCLVEAYKAMKIIFTHIMRITEEEFEQMLTDYEKECNEVPLRKERYRAIIQKRLDACGG